MIVAGNVVDILFRDVKVFGIKEIYRDLKRIPDGDVKTERITIKVKKPSTETYWKKCFAEVNLCVPYKNGITDTVRLTELERKASKLLESVGSFDGTTYRYSVETNQEDDSSLKCDYVNCRILFEVLNVKL
ncbi:MAG: hypothetical protein RRY36_10105 [Bacteroidaceae bacterium]